MAKNKSAKALACPPNPSDSGRNCYLPNLELTGNVPGVLLTGPHATDMVTDDARGER
ncbi:MAG: hypothetical protein PVH87_24045 [Desulfobacteraceae bacterium]